MWWLDINLRTETREAVAALLTRAAERYRDLELLQKRVGSDSPLVLGALEDIGQLLFRAVSGIDPAAFSPQRTEGTTRCPGHGRDGTREAIGYHLVVDPSDLALPWTALHNGVRFLIERHPICAATHGSRPASEPPLARPWMLRWHENAVTEDCLGPAAIGELVERFRPEPCAEPGVRFLGGWPGYGPHRLHEREQIADALETTVDGRRLARLDVPTGAPTPAEIVRAAHAYKAIHYAGTTSIAAAGRRVRQPGLNWDTPVPAPALEIPDEDDLEVVGVDPVTSLLDQISAKAEAGRLSRAPLDDQRTPVAAEAGAWQMEDGVLSPEDFAAAGVAPELVFANHRLGLTSLGARFLAAGASACVGPQLALASERATDFASAFYREMARGLSAGEALRGAALACRAVWGGHHPGWLAYGIVGHGALALQYL